MFIHFLLFWRGCCLGRSIHQKPICSEGNSFRTLNTSSGQQTALTMKWPYCWCGEEDMDLQCCNSMWEIYRPAWSDNLCSCPRLWVTLNFGPCPYRAYIKLAGQRFFPQGAAGETHRFQFATISISMLGSPFCFSFRFFQQGPWFCEFPLLGFINVCPSFRAG